VALARAADGALLAYVADADSRSVHTLRIDLHPATIDAGRELGRTRLEGAPRQLLVLPDGRVAATLSDGTRVAVLEPAADPEAPMVTLCTREVAPEPWGLALSPDDATLAVTSGWGAALTVLDAPTLAVERVVKLPREPRAVLVGDDGTAFVSHLVGARMSAVDLAGTAPTVDIDLGVRKSTSRARLEDMLAKRSGTQGYALARVALATRVGEAGPARILAPMVSVDPGDAERRSSVYYGPPFDGVDKEAAMVSVVDPATRAPLTRYLLGTSEAPLQGECLLPRAAAVRAKTGSLLVACFGIDALVELDALAVDPWRSPRRRFRVAPGPDGVAVDEASGRAVVFSQLGAVVSVIPLDAERDLTATIHLDYHPDPALAEARHGRQLFYRTDDARISGDGVGCSSCHVDGREDGLTWTTPMGPRQTPMLAGRVAHTAPYGWEGDRSTLADYIGNTVTRLGGRGLPAEDVDALAKYLLVASPPPARAAAPVDRELAERGRLLFEEGKDACASCHLGDESTDSAKHDLGGSFTPSPLDTPSLRSVAGTAPYFHDGRYPSLEALLGDMNSRMGHSFAMQQAERAALAAYLRTL
jgi:mono/diheme cytochrome c family protein/DNA-binding beta-propeller fold protein YncE